MNDLDQLPEIRNLVLLPFEAKPRCRKCGLPSRTFWTTIFFWRKAGEFSIGFCPGGKPPTEEVEIPIPFLSASHTRRYICAGMNKEHMNRQCPNCAYHWLSEVSR